MAISLHVDGDPMILRHHCSEIELGLGDVFFSIMANEGLF